MIKIENIAKKKLKNNELCIGVGLRQSRTVDIGKIMKTCGYDWLFIDMEHNSMDVDIVSQISVACTRYRNYTDCKSSRFRSPSCNQSFRLWGTGYSFSSC